MTAQIDWTDPKLWTRHNSLDSAFLYPSMDAYFAKCTPKLRRIGAQRKGSKNRPTLGIIDQWTLPSGNDIYVGYRIEE
jgi:hypothetical protein